MSETPSAYTQKGIAALKAGNYNLARQFFEAAIDDNPDDELAWLWMSSVVHTPAEKREYLKRVLEINPNNATAKRGLDMLGPDPGAPSDVMAEEAEQAAAPWIAIAAMESVPSSSRKKGAAFQRWELVVLIALAIAVIGVLVLLVITLATRGQPAPAPVPIALIGACSLMTDDSLLIGMISQLTAPAGVIPGREPAIQFARMLH